MNQTFDTAKTAEKTQASGPKATKSKPIQDAVINIGLPSFILMKLSGPNLLGPLWSFVLALAIPFAYAVYSAVTERKLNWIAALGLFSILASGALRYFEVGRIGFAFKEALTPAVIGIAVLVSLRSDAPLVTKMLYNDQLLDIQRIDASLAERRSEHKLKRLLMQTTLLLASSFFLSSFMNFSLAIWFLKSPVDSPAFNQELGKMTAMSWPMIVLPCIAVMAISLWHLGNGIRKLTGLSWEQIMKSEANKLEKQNPESEENP